MHTSNTVPGTIANDKAGGLLRGAVAACMLPGPPVPAIEVIEAHRKEYQQNMRDVVAHNPELLALLRERYEVGKRYEASKRKLFGWGQEKAAGRTGPEPLVPS